MDLPSRAMLGSTAIMSNEVEQYWNENLDPFGHRLPDPECLERDWQLAFRTYASPDILHSWSRLAPLEGLTVLELGSGLGCGAIHLARQGATVTALDISAARVRTAEAMRVKHHPSHLVTFRVGDAMALPFDEASFDRVFARDVLMYAQPSRVAAECRRVLKPGGRAVFNEALRGNPLAVLARRFSPDTAHAGIVRHLDATALQNLGGGLTFRETRCFHLLSAAAFWFLFRARSERGYRLTLRTLQPWDDLLRAILPGFPRLAWRGVAVYSRD